MLRDANAVETKVTALQIASLRRLSRASKVILMDGSGGVAKSVARELGRERSAAVVSAPFLPGGGVWPAYGCLVALSSESSVIYTAATHSRAGGPPVPLTARVSLLPPLVAVGRGFSNVFVLKGGFRSWVSSKLETRVARTVST